MISEELRNAVLAKLKQAFKDYYDGKENAFPFDVALDRFLIVTYIRYKQTGPYRDIEANFGIDGLTDDKYMQILETEYVRIKLERDGDDRV